MEDIVLSNSDGQILASSREIAKHFGKKHAELIYSIEGRVAWDNSKHKEVVKNNGLLMSGISQLSQMFVKSPYTDNRGREQYEYLMNRDGFSLLAMGFTGKKALEWKIKYIEAFNEMEEKLKHSNALTDEEKYKLMLFSKDPGEVVYAHNMLVQMETAPLQAAIKEQEPLVEFANQVSDTTGLIDMNEMAKLLKKEDIPIGRNRLFEILRNNKVLRWNNEPYQRYIDNGYFKVKEKTYKSQDGVKSYIKTFVTGKGQIWIERQFREGAFM